MLSLIMLPIAGASAASAYCHHSYYLSVINKVCMYMYMWQDVCVSVFLREKYSKVKNAAMLLLIEVWWMCNQFHSVHFSSS